MNKFQELWSIKENGGDSDIDVIKNAQGEISIYKKYYTTTHYQIKDNPTFLKKDIQKYHKIQNETKLIQNKISLKENITLLGNRIDTILIDILKLDEENIRYASDLKTKNRVIITNPSYIEGKTFNEYLKNIEYQKAKEIKQIISDNIISDKKTYPMNGGNFYLSQISTFNIKVLSIKEGTIKLLITDIAHKISEIIK